MSGQRVLVRRASSSFRWASPRLNVTRIRSATSCRFRYAGGSTASRCTRSSGGRKASISPSSSTRRSRGRGPQGGAGELLGVGEQPRHPCEDPPVVVGLEPDAFEKVGEQVEARVSGLVLDGLLGGLPGQEVLDQAVFFLLGGELAGDAFRGAELAVRGLLARQELLGDGGVVLGTFGARGEDQRGELGVVGLAVAVDAAVALLDADQRPGQVIVDEVVGTGGACSRPRTRRRR